MKMLTVIDRRPFVNKSDYHTSYISQKIQIQVDLE
jgi:hypothetical protein